MRALVCFTCLISSVTLFGCSSTTDSSSTSSTAGSPAVGTAGATGSAGHGGATAQAGGSGVGGSASFAGSGGTFGASGSVGSGGASGSLGTAGSTSGGSAGAATGGSGGNSSTGGSASGGSAGAAGAGGAASSSITCIDGTCLNPECKPYKTAAAIDANPETGFDEKPDFIPNDVIIPTLDDVPDDVMTTADQAHGKGGWTTKDLAWLDAHHMHWDLFINTDNACDLVDAPTPDGCNKAIADILKNHYPANHTVHHYHLGMATADGCGDAACVKTELQGVETFINAASGGARPHLTRFRAPFGEPYQEGPGAAGYNFVPAAVSPFAVSVGWNLDSDDSNHDDGTNCTDSDGNPAACPTGAVTAGVVEGLIKTPGKGAYGIVLMHGLFSWTYDALPLLFDPTTGYLAKNKFRVGTVEDAICWKYGKHSWEIVAAKGQARNPN